MTVVLFPYGRGYVEVDLPGSRVYTVQSMYPEGVFGTEAVKLVDNSLSKPIASKRIEDIVGSDSKVAILITDKTRATPNKILLERVLVRLRWRGIPRDSIKIVVATGLHKPHTYSEIVELVGEDIASEYIVESHDSDDAKNLVYLGRTSYGTEVHVNKSVVDSNIVIGVGLLEPHFFAGYSGGRKLIVPGVAGTSTVYQNHSYGMLNNPKADYGFLEGNPVHEDMVEASRLVKNYRYILHVILDRSKKMVDVFAGDVYEAHKVGVETLNRYARIEVPYEADVAVVSNGGYPLDRDLYQSVKGMVTASRVVRRNGVIIVLSECIDGVGHEHFRELASMDKDPAKILKHIELNEPLRDQWQVQKLAQVLLKNRVVVVTKNVSHSILEEMNLIPASSIEEAIKVACTETPCSRMVAIPEGPYVIPSLR
ncbi:MAG: nickel-dependent lactate racemase [Ignisphaera sp.]|nr:nickel-dependent lactate racemase [Ignisphaera sp.]MCX8167545.1 nickel-dependent lactate racemase [Ignisphaera sp.]MDW8086285.1 nickel-dependent lactate racemase [Ignisphaera sp.]